MIACGPFKQARLSQVRFAEEILQGMSQIRGSPKESVAFRKMVQVSETTNPTQSHTSQSVTPRKMPFASILFPLP